MSEPVGQLERFAKLLKHVDNLMPSSCLTTTGRVRLRTGDSPPSPSPTRWPTTWARRPHKSCAPGTRAARTDERRVSRKKQDWRTGVPAEHITDYWCAKNKRNLKKANNNGKLWEEWDKGGRQGIDHVWMQSGESSRPGVIGETKSSLFGAFRFLQALPADIRQQLTALGQAEAASPTPSGHPNVFHSEGRDGVTPRAGVEGTAETETEIKKGVGKANPETGLPTQMSHAWVQRALPHEALTPAGKLLADKVRRWQLIERRRNPHAPAPCARWIIMVTGRQKHLHEAKQGHQHEIQKPLVALPDLILFE